MMTLCKLYRFLYLSFVLLLRSKRYHTDSIYTQISHDILLEYPRYYLLSCLSDCIWKSETT